MNPDFATSRWGQWKGCRCHGCGRSLKMVHISCCVSITTVTCLRQRRSGWGRKREMELAEAQVWTITTYKQKIHFWQKLIAIHLTISLQFWLRDTLSHLCIWAILASVVWCNSRWGCRSATLQQNRLSLFNTIFLFLVFFFPFLFFLLVPEDSIFMV